MCEDLFGPGEHKQNFFVFDFCQNLEFFSQNPATSDGASSEPLSARLFKGRLEMIAELDKRQKYGMQVSEALPKGIGHLTEEQLRDETAELLRARVAAMNIDNFVVRPQRQFVEKYVEAKAWKQLSDDDHAALEHRIANLPSQQADEDEEAIPERAIVDAGADQVFQVRMSHRTDIARTTGLFRGLLAELEVATGSIDVFTRLGAIMDTSGTDDNGRHRRDLLNETYQKVISTVGRIDGAKKVTEMLEKLVRLEREAYGISTLNASNTDPLASLLKRIGRSALPVVAKPPSDDDSEH